VKPRGSRDASTVKTQAISPLVVECHVESFTVDRFLSICQTAAPPIPWAAQSKRQPIQQTAFDTCHGGAPPPRLKHRLQQITAHKHTELFSLSTSAHQNLIATITLSHRLSKAGLVGNIPPRKQATGVLREAGHAMLQPFRTHREQGISAPQMRSR